MLYGLIVKMRKHRYSRVFPHFLFYLNLNVFSSVSHLVSFSLKLSGVPSSSLYPDGSALPGYLPVTCGHSMPMLGSFHARPPSSPDDRSQLLCSRTQLRHLIRGSRVQSLRLYRILVLFCKFYAKPFAVCLRTCTKVNSNIKYASFDYTYKLSLRKFFLEV